MVGHVLSVDRRQIHPSELPENRERTALHHDFHHEMMPQVGELLGVGSCYSPPPGQERAWRLFFGVNVGGTHYYVCHVAEHFSTAVAYNSCDPNIPCPNLLWGEPFHIDSTLMQRIRDNFPAHHSGHLPFQAAFAITCKTAPTPRTFGNDLILSLVDGTNASIETDGFEVTLLDPSGTESLSFKRDGFPLEVWTHTSRAPVIRTALELENRKLIQALSDRERAQVLERVSIYQDACDLEDELSQITADLTILGRVLASKQDDLNRATISEARIVQNTRIPVERRTELLRQKVHDINVLRRDVANLNNLIAQKRSEATQCRQRISAFKKEHFASLPHSYREATFQLSFEATLPCGSTVYKQFDETGHFVLSSTADKTDSIHARFGNAVHLPYTAIMDAIKV